MSRPVFHMIGNAHIDPVWLWPWQEGFQEIKATFRSALDRLDEYPDFIFCASSAAFYAWVEESDPELFARIVARVREGRWVPTGGWWVEPDCNIPSGESFVRQGLYGQRYFLSRFGRQARVAWNLDAFGHSGALPQILRKSGLDASVFLRPGPHEKDLSARHFVWEGDEGSRVDAFRILFEYCAWPKELEAHITRCAAELKEGEVAALCFYGVGNHGGGPTRANLDSLAALDARPELPHLRLSSPEAYFDEERERRSREGVRTPVVRGELLHHASGCYAAHSGIKAWNRRTEQALVAAEKLSVLARLALGRPIPTDFERAWKGVLFNQFHDILAGTSLEAAYDDARDAYGEALSIAARNANAAAQALSWQVDIPFEEGARPLVLVNPHAFESRVPVEFEAAKPKGDFRLEDEAGRELPLQVLSSSCAAGGRVRLAFLAELPAFGYRSYRIRPLPSAAAFPALEADGLGLANARWALRFDARTGCLASLRHRATGVELLGDLAARALVIDDPSDTWSHGIRRFDTVVADFELAAIDLVERGPERASIRVAQVHGASRLTQTYTLHAGSDRIDVEARLFWTGARQALKLAFPLALEAPILTAETPYGHVERPLDGDEYPLHSWIDLSGDASGVSLGLSILNESRTAYSAGGDELRLTLLRSPLYAHHEPFVPAAHDAFAVQDQGPQRFAWALLPHEGSWRDSGVPRRAQEFVQRPVVVCESFHPGPLAASGSYLAVDAPNVDILAAKAAESSEGLVLRAVETQGLACQAALRLASRPEPLALRFAPGEIKTILIPDSGASPRELPMTELEATP